MCQFSRKRKFFENFDFDFRKCFIKKGFFLTEYEPKIKFNHKTKSIQRIVKVGKMLLHQPFFSSHDSSYFTHFDHAEKVVSDSPGPGLVDFAIGFVNSVQINCLMSSQ